MLGKGAKLATVNFQMDNFGTPKLDGAKPYIVNKNGTNLASPLTWGKRTFVFAWGPPSLIYVAIHWASSMTNFFGKIKYKSLVRHLILEKSH